jgi:hypothetical protein
LLIERKGEKTMLSVKDLMILVAEGENFERHLLETDDRRLVELANQIHDAMDIVKAKFLS